jgi:SAM-dependent methyltransferase
MAYSSCNLCSAQDFELIRPYPGFDGVDLVACRACGLMQAQPVPSDDFLREFYGSSFGKDPLLGFDMTDRSERGFRTRARHQLHFIGRALAEPLAPPAGARVLDVGCHAASLLSLFKERGWEVTGVDPNPRSAYGEKWYGIPVIQKLFSPGMFAPESFDAILHSHALEHVPDPKEVLAEFLKVLKPGGWVFIEVPNESRAKVAAQRVIPHLYFFTPRTLAELARRAGFEVVSVRVLGIPPLKARWGTPAFWSWLALRWQARCDARGRENLLTFLPFFGRIFKEDRYFASGHPEAQFLRIMLRKPKTAPVARACAVEERA